MTDKLEFSQVNNEEIKGFWIDHNGLMIGLYIEKKKRRVVVSIADHVPVVNTNGHQIALFVENRAPKLQVAKDTRVHVLDLWEVVEALHEEIELRRVRAAVSAGSITDRNLPTGQLPPSGA